MFQIDALPAFSDNYIWLIQDPATRRCAVIDPGDAKPVQAWLDAHPDWHLSDILITHHHPDHVGGVSALKATTGARVWGPALEKIPERDEALDDGQHIEILALEFVVHLVPGHTLGHIAYYHAAAGQPWLFCGDTLFAAGCGRLFEGTPQQMHNSLQTFAGLPNTTQVYCAHEYTLSNLHFARAVEPANEQIAARFAEVEAWRAQGRISLPSTLALEKSTNPFLRCDEPDVRKKVDERDGVQARSASEVFARLRAWKDEFRIN